MQGYEFQLCLFTTSHGRRMVIKRERTISSNWDSEKTSYFFLKMKNLIDFVNTIKMNCGCLK